MTNVAACPKAGLSGTHFEHHSASPLPRKGGLFPAGVVFPSVTPPPRVASPMVQEVQCVMQQLSQSYDCLLHDLRKVNILILGKTGAGKSSLVNAIFGEKWAETGYGEPVTKELGRYSHSSKSVVVYDTKGLEHGGHVEFMEETTRFLSDLSSGDDVKEHLHVVWYVVDLAHARFQDFEARFCRDVISSTPLFFVLNKSDTATEQQREAVRELLEQQQLENCKGIFEVASDRKNWLPKCCPECQAEDIRFRGRSHELICDTCGVRRVLETTGGLEDLITATMRELPELARFSFVKSQQITERQHVEVAAAIVIETCLTCCTAVQSATSKRNITATRMGTSPTSTSTSTSTPLSGTQTESDKTTEVRPMPSSPLSPLSDSPSPSLPPSSSSSTSSTLPSSSSPIRTTTDSPSSTPSPSRSPSSHPRHYHRDNDADVVSRLCHMTARLASLWDYHFVPSAVTREVATQYQHHSRHGFLQRVASVILSVFKRPSYQAYVQSVVLLLGIEICGVFVELKMQALGLAIQQSAASNPVTSPDSAPAQPSPSSPTATLPSSPLPTSSFPLPSASTPPSPFDVCDEWESMKPQPHLHLDDSKVEEVARELQTNGISMVAKRLLEERVRPFLPPPPASVPLGTAPAAKAHATTTTSQTPTPPTPPSYSATTAPPTPTPPASASSSPARLDTSPSAASSSR
eukprot:TRINITY_DN3138_c1_g1_i1.p1 TRINITY_DN3138_c1_g1~~TRINITY_DN3138_c1_g1_i1.p1  ORF type:complete len:691 (+),score=172.26 TRINITY_DN3138_c1_g1_i1:327-2399(+)